jgi:chlorobactene glucosyltransferase
MLTPLLIYALLLLAVLVAFLAIVLVNLAVLPTIGAALPQLGGHPPRVAALVPARNEQGNVEACLRPLLRQDYPNLEVWLYDDASTDGTAEIAARVQAEYPSILHVVHGTEEPPAGWLGKPHACHRLYQDLTHYALRTGVEPDYVLFTDADVRFEPSAVSAAVALAEQRHVGLLSIFPRQETVSWAERLAVPILSHFAVYTFLPLPLAFTLRSGPAFAAANGQFMLFTRQAYEACGGHAAVRSQVLEDVALARVVKRVGYLALLADGGPLVRTRMYGSPAEVWQGYSKNLYAFFGYSPFFLALGIVSLLALYVLPILLAMAFLPSPAGFIFLAQYVVAVLTRLVLSIRFKYPLLDALLHPIGIACVIAIAINSAIWAKRGKGAWKGRTVKAG